MTIGRWIILVALALAASALPAHAAAPALPTLLLTPGQDAAEAAPYIRYAKRPAGVGADTLDALLAGPLARITGPTIHFGPPGTRTVLFLRVRNGGSDPGSWIFTTGRGSLKYFRLYEVAGGRPMLRVDGTDGREARDNLRTYQAFSSELVLQPREEKLILIDFLSENSTYMPIRIETYGSFFKDRRANIAMVSGVVLGVVILILLNFLFFQVTGYREFVWLAIAQGFFALNTVHSEGYITIFFLADKPLLGVGIEDAIKCGFAAAMAQFCRSFVRTATHFPHRDLTLRILIGAALALAALQPGLAIYPPAMRAALHIGVWFVAVAVALFLPFVGFAAMQQIGRQLWPLFVGWAALALFIVYAAVASMGVFTWLPIDWHLAGPVGLFESLMVTLALGLNLRKIQADKLAADAKYAQSMAERVAISERAARLAEEKAFALATVNSQNALLHASGHDSKQVILALNSAVEALKRTGGAGAHDELTRTLQSSATYLSEIVSTTISGANIVGAESDFVALGCFRAAALTEPLAMMFKTSFAAKGLTLATEIAGDAVIVSDKPLLMRALANLLSNAYKYTERGGATIRVAREDGRAIITVADTGRGMSDAVRTRLADDAVTRLRGDERVAGTGSGFQSARRLVQSLAGSLRIAASGSEGTTIEIVLPCAFAATTPVSIDELQSALTGWRLLDFDAREDFEAAIAAADTPRERIVALTYDDTTVTRGRLSETAGMMMIKPVCREAAQHPLFALVNSKVSEQA
ncbi:sensor histidine kinase [Sphingopyxis indica]|uniref:sensor histidine kinase n=1 Tax=Sphingopyxis indica TaxID=436663 RepID=UPI00293950A6|nr:sensor histidine kinase [Sphingopyxis indica]WOF43571.1 sensor histidine kinase [Sphingopyxis indica]